MLKIYRVDTDNYMVATPTLSIHGNAMRTAIVMNRVGIDWDEIEAGLVSLETNNHHVAEYGINGTFLFSKSIYDVFSAA